METIARASRRAAPKYLLVRYERCARCARALNVDVLIDPLTHNFHIQPGICQRCSKPR
jgi:hypothetical protein